MSSASPNQFAAEIDFVNPKEAIEILFWAFNDRTGSVSVTGRAPDVEFAVEPWKPTIDTATTIGIKLHYVVFWIGTVVVLFLLGFGAYKLAAYLIKFVKLALSA